MVGDIDAAVEVLEMPFFFLPGNHDLNNPASVAVWHERHGGTCCSTACSTSTAPSRATTPSSSACTTRPVTVTYR